VFRLKAEGHKTSRPCGSGFQPRSSQQDAALTEKHNFAGSPTQMPEVLGDHAWFDPKSLLSSAFSLST
jgi:hypothetical protein